jgi:hypothetical protein
MAVVVTTVGSLVWNTLACYAKDESKTHRTTLFTAGQTPTSILAVGAPLVAQQSVNISVDSKNQQRHRLVGTKESVKSVV